MAQEYQVYGETNDKAIKKSYWNAAKGLQKVDGLNPAKYLSDLAKSNIEGKLTYQQVEELLYERYENETEEDIENQRNQPVS